MDETVSSERGQPRRRKRQPVRRKRWLVNGYRGASIRSAMAIIILLIWAVSTVFDIVSARYDPPEGLNTIALAAVTYLFGSAFLQENERNGGSR